MYKSITNDLKIFAKHLTVLIAEDEVSLGDELKSLLDLFFNKVYFATDGEIALNMYKKYRCDIIITDLNMPKINGVELSRQIRTLDKDQVIMVLSGHIDTYVIDLIDIGIQTLLIKPYDSTTFLQKLLVQCENILLRKEFEKIKLNKVLERNAKKEIKKVEVKKELKSPVVNNLIDEVIASKTTDETISDYIKNFNISDKVDDVMWKHISEDILELNNDYEDNINLMTLNGFDYEIKDELVRIFSRYNSSLLLLPGMESMALIFNDLSITLDDLDLENFNENSLEVFGMLEFFYEDITKFFNVVFVEKECSNINYLTDSMKSSVLQLKVKLGLIKMEEDDELELF